MKTQTSTKRALLFNLLSMVICLSMLVGSTFAWFTDTASTAVNKIQAGELDIQLLDADGNELGTEPLKWVAKDGRAQSEILWEPGATYSLESFRIKNNGNLALKYKVVISGIQGNAKLLEVIDFTYKTTDDDGATTAYDVTTEHVLEAGKDSGLITITGHMQETAGNEYMNETIDGIAITVYATQATVENDSNDNTYDEDASYPVVNADELATALANGGIVTVGADITADATKGELKHRVQIIKSTTLNLENMYTVPGELEATNNWAGLYIGADMTINASANGGINCTDKADPNASYVGGAYVAHITGGTVTVNGGTYYAGGTVFNVQRGTLIINGGFFAVTPDIGTNDCRYLLNCIDANYKNGTANITVKGGTFVNFNPADNAAEGNGTNFVADGYKVVSETKANGDIWYTVVPQ